MGRIQAAVAADRAPVRGRNRRRGGKGGLGVLESGGDLLERAGAGVAGAEQADLGLALGERRGVDRENGRRRPERCRPR